MIARSTLWGTTQLGEDFYRFTPEEQAAILAHERGHIHHRHALKRLAWVLTLRAVFKPQAFFAMCEAQELEADKFAVRAGHFNGLSKFLSGRFDRDAKSVGYPTARQRLDAIYYG